MSIHVYQFLHYAGLFLVFTTLGAVSLHVMAGGNKQNNSFRKLVAISHGVGLVLVLVAGFGMLARLGIHGFPGWVIAKLVIWLILGGAIAFLYRDVQVKLMWFLLPLLGGVAGLLAVTKPF